MLSGPFFSLFIVSVPFKGFKDYILEVIKVELQYPEIFGAVKYENEDKRYDMKNLENV